MAGRVAFCSVPHHGGIYSVYRRLRAATKAQGWDVQSVEIGDERSRWYGHDATLAGPEHTIVTPATAETRDGAMAFARWVEDEGIDVVMPMSSRIALSAVPHLRGSTAIVTRCVDITPYCYRLATTCLERTDRIVVTSPRQRVDLIGRYRVPASRIRHVPNAVEVTRFALPRPMSEEGTTLRIVVLDRMEHRQKRIFMLAGILRRLDAAGIPFSVTIIGDGPDLPSLRERLAEWIEGGRVHCLGAVANEAVPPLLAHADVLLKPSRNEGFPSALIEAMAARVVPVISRIAGVTDWIVREGETGLLCPIDDETAFAEACAHLHRHPVERSRMAENAHADVIARFGLDDFGERWGAVFAEATADGIENRPVRSWSTFAEPRVFHGSRANRLIWRWLPRSFKDDARAWLERRRAGLSGGS